MLRDHSPVCPVCNVGVFFGPTARWIKIPLGTEVGQATLSYMGTQLPSTERDTAAPTFRALSIVTQRSPYAIRPLSVCPVCLSVCNFGVLWPNGWTDQDETWLVGRPRPWPHCVRWGPSSPFPKRPHPNFWPISVAAKWLQGSRCHLVWR